MTQMERNIELKPAHEGPIIIERFQPQHEHLTQHGQKSYSFTRNCTSLNLQFVSIQKMDSVLHSIQRRLYKQKEQRVFAEFIKSNYASTESGMHFGQIDAGRVFLERGSKKKFDRMTNASAKVHLASGTINRSAPKELLSNENTAIKEVVKELKTCIAALNTFVNQGNNEQFNNDDRLPFPQGKDKIIAFSRKSLPLQNRPKNTNSLRGTTIYKPEQVKKVEHKIKHALKSKSITDKRITADLKHSRGSIELATNAMLAKPILPIKYFKSTDSRLGNAFDAVAIWKSLSEMEKIDELVRRNLQMINLKNISTNDKVKATSRKENAVNIGTSTTSSVSEVKSSAHGSMGEKLDMTATVFTRNHNFRRFGHHNSFATKFLSPNSDIVATVKELSNTVVDELLIEVSNEILDLPEAFLTELLETEFANNNIHR